MEQGAFDYPENGKRERAGASVGTGRATLCLESSNTTVRRSVSFHLWYNRPGDGTVLRETHPRIHLHPLFHKPLPCSDI